VGAFGEKLRKQREQRGLALEAISNTTKISPRMLRALEEEHFDQLPGGVFNKGFVRAYARQVGLDEEEAVSDYLAALRESQIQQQSILPDFRTPAGKPKITPVSDLASRDLRKTDVRKTDLRTNDLSANDGNDHDGQPRPEESKKNESKNNESKKEDRIKVDPKAVPASPVAATHPVAEPSARRFPNKYPAGDPTQSADESSARIPWGMLAAALLLVTLLLALWNLRRPSTPKTASLPAASSHQASAANPDPVAPAAPTKPAASANSLTAGSPSPAGTLSVGTKSSSTLSSGTISTQTTQLTAAPTLPGEPPSSPAAGKPAANSPTATTNPPPSKPTTRSSAVKPPPSFTLLIRAEKTTWISIVADGKPVAEETLIAPAHTSIRASHEILVRAGNAAGVSFVLNGKEFPAQGNDGEVKTYAFDATGLRVVP